MKKLFTPFIDNRSDNGLWRVIVWYSNHITKIGQSQITLSRRVGPRWKPVWSRYLINNRSPQEIIVSNTGKWVLTMGEIITPGFQPLWVCYGIRGEVFMIHSRQSLPAATHDSRYTLERNYWAEHSINAISPDDSRFYLLLKSGILAVFDLGYERKVRIGSINGYANHLSKNGGVSSHERSEAIDLLTKKCLIYLDSSNPNDRMAGIVCCGNLKLNSSIEKLNQLLLDTSSFDRDIGDGKGLHPVYYIRQASMRAIAKIRRSK